MNVETCRLITVGIAVWFVLLPCRATADQARPMTILKVQYSAVPGTDVEHGQGAIERNELEHCVLAPAAWLIRVPAPAVPAEWNRRLDASVDPRYGCFIVQRPSEEELRLAASGELAFQK